MRDEVGGDFLCTEPGIYDLTMSCTRVVRAQVGFLAGVGWYWQAPGEASNDDWSLVVGSTRVLDAAPPEQTGAWSLVNQLMERTNSPTPRLALYAVGRLLQRWHDDAAEIAKACESGDWSQVKGDGGSETVNALMKLVEP